MQQFNLSFLLKDLMKLSCKQNHMNHLQRFLPVIIINIIIYSNFFNSNYLLFNFITIIVFSYFKQNLAACIFNQLFYFIYMYIYTSLVLGFPRISWNLVIVFVSRYLYVV